MFCRKPGFRRFVVLFDAEIGRSGVHCGFFGARKRVSRGKTFVADSETRFRGARRWSRPRPCGFLFKSKHFYATNVVSVYKRFMGMQKTRFPGAKKPILSRKPRFLHHRELFEGHDKVPALSTEYRQSDFSPASLTALASFWNILL